MGIRRRGKRKRAGIPIGVARFPDHALNTPWRPNFGWSILGPMNSTQCQRPSPTATRALLQAASLVTCCSALVLVAGCDTEPDSHLVSAPPPSRAMVVTTTTTTPVVVANPAVVMGNGAYVATATGMPAVSTIIVSQAPPAPQQELVLAQPSPQHVWLVGYWTWRNDRYEWMAGHWQLPPYGTSVWVSPTWEQEGNAYRFHEGYWR